MGGDFMVAVATTLTSNPSATLRYHTNNDYTGTNCINTEHESLIDIRTVKLRDGSSRLENALYFLEQVKNPHKFKVGEDIVEICFVGKESLSDVLVKHFNRRA